MGVLSHLALYFMNLRAINDLFIYHTHIQKHVILNLR